MTAGWRWLRTRGRMLAGTVRFRATLAAVVVVGAALTVAAVALVATLHRTLTDQVRSAARIRAEEVAASLESGTGPPALMVAEHDAQLVQVLDEAGGVVAASPNIAGAGALARLRPGESGPVHTPLDDDPFLAVAVAADTPAGRRTVVVGQSLADVSEPAQVVTDLLLLGLPALLALVAVTTWRAAGRALAPVEAIRREVEEISAAELHRRVPRPRTGDEIDRLASTVNHMLARLEGAQASQRRFVADASHELRSPVAAIRQHAEVALAHPDRAPTADLAATVRAESLRMQRLVDDLLLLAKADERTLGLRRAAVDLDDLVFDAAGRLRASTTVRVDTTGVSAGRVTGDAMGLLRVVQNLGENAARHARTTVSFGLSEVDNTVVLVVDDDGPGIPAPDRSRIFERFVRLDDARARDDGGSGLGLAIVAELVAAHGGSVSVGASCLGGARVEVIFPVDGPYPA
jgi:signal transduction histidine kinase